MKIVQGFLKKYSIGVIYVQTVFQPIRLLLREYGATDFEVSDSMSIYVIGRVVDMEITVFD